MTNHLTVDCKIFQENLVFRDSKSCRRESSAESRRPAEPEPESADYRCLLSEDSVLGLVVSTGPWLNMAEDWSLQMGVMAPG